MDTRLTILSLLSIVIHRNLNLCAKSPFFIRVESGSHVYSCSFFLFIYIRVVSPVLDCTITT